MKKNFKVYALIWAVLLAIWCSVVFLVQPGSRYEKYDFRFWIAFLFIVLAFVGNLVCAHFAFKADSHKKMFLNLPLITVSWSALIAMIVVGAILMLIPDYSEWIAVVICIIILGFNAIAVIKAGWAADEVNKVDEKIKIQTSFIKNLTAETESILSRAKSEAVEVECKKVYEAVRYSDPVSNDALSIIEAEISVKVDEFASAVSMDDAEKVKEIAEEIVVHISERNKKRRALK